VINIVFTDFIVKLKRACGNREVNTADLELSVAYPAILFEGGGGGGCSTNFFWGGGKGGGGGGAPSTGVRAAGGIC